MPRASEARAWWADVEDVRERIERRRAREDRARAAEAFTGAPAPSARRGVREIRPGKRLTLVHSAAPTTYDSRKRPRPRVSHRMGARPDRAAALAVGLGFLLVLVAMLSAHS